MKILTSATIEPGQILNNLPSAIRILSIKVMLYLKRKELMAGATLISSINRFREYGFTRLNPHSGSLNIPEDHFSNSADETYAHPASEGTGGFHDSEKTHLGFGNKVKSTVLHMLGVG